MGYDWDFSFLWPYWPAFLRGTWVTIKLSVFSSILGTVGGFGWALVLRLKWFGAVLLFLNDVVRAIPMLVLMLFLYYFPLPALIGRPPLAPYTSALLALTIAQLVFTADVVRAAMDQVSPRSIAGAKALGLRSGTIWWYIVLPDVWRQVFPTMLAFFIGNIKLSSLASVIGTEEVVFTARVAIGQRFRSLEAWVLVSLIYVALVLPLSWWSRAVERSAWLKRR